MPKIVIKKATPAQTDHIDRLSNDLCYNRAARNLNVSEIAKRPIKYLDELTLDEASNVIQEFITRRGY